jgi:TfoX/Sxy family transcriptional regulator of competence genes
MSYNENLANRCREIIAQKEDLIEEKKMFGGLCFMVNDKMCFGVMKDKLMLRLNPEKMEDIFEMDGCEPMDFTGKSMKGFVYVAEEVLTSTKKLDYWIQLAVDYNPLAKSSKKKK